MRGVNEVTIIGNLGDDPTVRYTQAGAAITTISVATTEKWKNKDGEQQEKTSWHRVKFFNRLAEIAGEYLKKGRQVYIKGKLDYGSYEKDGVTHYTTDIIAEQMQLLGANPGGEREERQQQAPQRQQPPAQQQGGGNYSQRSGGGPIKPPPSGDAFDDSDIPFVSNIGRW
jgi:single-strand DNA-binding protein